MAEQYLDKGSKVILVTAKPSWVNVAEECEMPQAWATLAMLEHLICRKEATLALTLTGDRHHYCRYQGTGAEATRHKVTAGGAGAFLSATHALPCQLHLPGHGALSEVDGGSWRTWDRQKVYPDECKSREIVGTLNKPPIWRHTRRFAVLTAGIYALLALAGALAVETDAVGFPLPTLLAVALCVGLWALADVHCAARRPKLRRAGYAAAHAAMHLLPLALVVAGVLVGVHQRDFNPLAKEILDFLGVNALRPDEIAPAMSAAVAVSGATVIAGLLGFFWGPTAFAFYLTRAHSNPLQHTNQIFAAQTQTAGRRYKHFLRLQIKERGAAKVHVIAAPPVPSLSDGGWKKGDGSETGPWVEPKSSLAPDVLESFEAH
jgi:hypothetical protein